MEDTAVTPTGSVTPSAATKGQRSGIRSTGVVSDPAIDEHFKRSLGLKDYAAVFDAASANADKDTGLSGESPPPVTSEGVSVRGGTPAPGKAELGELFS